MIYWTGYDLLSPVMYNTIFILCFRYIYVPLGGSRHGLLCKMLSTGLAFGFVCLWHGGHDYLQYWALMNWVGVLVENGLKRFFSISFIHSMLVSLKSIYISKQCIDILPWLFCQLDVQLKCVDMI